MIEVNEITKVFRVKKGEDIKAVDHVSFKCSRGEIYGLLGPNGAGKTTMLRMLSTALKPVSGGGTVAGWDLIKNPDKVRENIGFLSSATGLYRRLTGREMLVYFGKLNGMVGDELTARVNELVQMMDMTSFAGVKCDKLSSGQKQRVSICRSIVHDPPVMIFDEPAEGLDVIAAETIVNFIKDCRNRGKCVIFSTHVMREAEKLCDRIGIINKGRICAEGSLTQLSRQYDSDDLEIIFRRAVETV